MTSNYQNLFSVEPTESCPYCGETCHADFVDNGFGPYAVQCGPYHCDGCGASEVGPEGGGDEATGWYPPDSGQVSPYANTVNGVLVDHVTAKVMYDLGLLDRQPANNPPIDP